ncbi:MAG TPA: pyruvate dehydrogenase (acetyl-transferring) E1 component subunit alpha [Arenicellales bacterium]|nr:pyruvate dehydrogenase (acetyl-transferring) E1 component subunit alpha [Arenicellales bacterium]
MISHDPVPFPDAAPDELGREHALGLMRTMLLIRRFEEKCAELYTREKIRGFLHLAIGEEAIPAGAFGCLRQEDEIVATYREHGHAIARGIPLTSLMAEMYGKVSGCSRGRGGSMHIFDKDTRFVGGNAIVGGGLPLAVGLSLAARMQHSERIAACFFGEGAVAEGEFHESMNLAALWSLPVVFICENNYYAMGTALERSQSQLNLMRRAQSYNISAVSTDGMNVLAVAQVMREVTDRVREEQKPVFVEMRTYRFRAHSMFDPELYRDKQEVEDWKQRGPIVRYAEALEKWGWWSDAEQRAMEADIDGEIDQAVEFAEAADWEPVEDLTRFVYSEQEER